MFSVSAKRGMQIKTVIGNVGAKKDFGEYARQWKSLYYFVLLASTTFLFLISLMRP